MNPLREAAQQALEALKSCSGVPHWPALQPTIDALRAALAQPDDWTRCHHCGQTMPPVPLGQAEPDLSRCPQCNGPADNGHDRSIPPNPYLCTKCMAEPVQEQAESPCACWPGRLCSRQAQCAADVRKQQAESKPLEPDIAKIVSDNLGKLYVEDPAADETHGCHGGEGSTLPAQEQAEPLNLLDRAVQRRLAAQWGYVPAEQAEPVQEPVAWMSDSDVGFDRSEFGATPTVPLYTAPPRRTMVPLTDEEILAAVGWERAEMYMKLTPNFPVDEAKKETLKNARAIEKASWEKNNGKA